MSELQRLRDRVEQLEDMLGIGKDTTSQLCNALKLTRDQAKTVGLLLNRAVATREAIFFVQYGDKPECEHPHSEKVLDKHLCLIRKRLKARGIEISTIWGEGWHLTHDQKAKLRELMQ